VPLRATVGPTEGRAPAAVASLFPVNSVFQILSVRLRFLRVSVFVFL
jgi:hypothetical protein